MGKHPCTARIVGRKHVRASHLFWDAPQRGFVGLLAVSLLGLVDTTATAYVLRACLPAQPFMAKTDDLGGCLRMFMLAGAVPARCSELVCFSFGRRILTRTECAVVRHQL